ncbi:MAG: hypothetical protein AB8G05_26670 [Oligoflexales bacterium]
MVKSAIEIAMEKSANITVDPEVFKRIELKKIASKALNELYEDSEASLLNKLNLCGKNDLSLFIRICEEILLGNVEIPISQEGHNFVKRSLEILTELKANSAETFISHIYQVLEHYKRQKDEVLERLKQESESGRMHMQRRMAKQLGAELNVPLESDPNYKKNKDQMMGQLNRQYTHEIERLKSELKSAKNSY